MFFKAKNSTHAKNTSANKRNGQPMATRMVTESRWVHRNQLELGMYVSDLDKPWEQTRFMFQGFKIDSYETLKEVQEACEYANVQTEKLVRIPTNSVHRLVAATR